MKLVEYIWLDGSETQKLRSKCRLIPEDKNFKDKYPKELQDPSTYFYDVWGFDGSSTDQALITNDETEIFVWNTQEQQFEFKDNAPVTDKTLVPVKVFDTLDNYGIRGRDNKAVPTSFVLCEVWERDEPHRSNTRARLRDVLENVKELDIWFGVEQEYTLMKPGLAKCPDTTSLPYGWPDTRGPIEQGPFYCGIGANEIKGRQLVEDHLMECIKYGLKVYGMNAEVQPSQWEFQLGYRGQKEPVDALTIADELWFARFLLNRLGEKHDIAVELQPKLFSRFNGAGLHTNFSTAKMREDYAEIADIIKKLAQKHREHTKESNYGYGIKERLSGKHETARHDQFTYAIGGRTGCSVRIPLQVAEAQKGYIEDRRPCSNANPYNVFWRILETIRK